MSARRTRAFRPTVAGLEDRTVFSRGLGTPPPVHALTTAGAGATTPAPGNLAISAADWVSLHQEYAARARRHGDAVVFLGDSYTYLWGDPRRQDRPDMAEPMGAAAWDRLIAPARAANFGVLGDQTQNLLWRVENGELAGRPRVAVVLIGVNNLIHGQTPQETAAGVAAVVNAVRRVSPRTRVLLLGLLPPNAGPNDPLRVEAGQVNVLIAGLAGRGVTYLDLSGALLNPDGTPNSALFSSPSIHPSPEGYWALSRAIEPTLRRMTS